MLQLTHLVASVLKVLICRQHSFRQATADRRWRWHLDLNRRARPVWRWCNYLVFGSTPTRPTPIEPVENIIYYIIELHEESAFIGHNTEPNRINFCKIKLYTAILCQFLDIFLPLVKIQYCCNHQILTFLKNIDQTTSIVAYCQHPQTAHADIEAA